MVGVGEAADLIHHAQIAWMPAAERRRYALTGPTPPDWFTEMRPPPWIDDHVISEGRELAGVSLVAVPDGLVPPGPDLYVPAQRHPDVPSDVPHPDTATRTREVPGPARQAGRHRAPDAHDGQVVTSTGTGGRHRANPADHTGADSDSDEEPIIGIAAAARFFLALYGTKCRHAAAFRTFRS